MNLRTKLTFMAMLLYCMAIVAQESFDVSGTVLGDEDGLPIPGVNVVIFGTEKGTSTDFDGNFSLKAKEGDVLQFSNLGYVTRLITVKSNVRLEVKLKQDANLLDEVVVVGYGTQKNQT